MKKIGLKKARANAWSQFSLFIRLRDSIKTTGTKQTCLCITCGNSRPTGGKGCVQAGHFIPGRGNSVLFEEDQVNGQCYVCNYRLKGNWVEYECIMIERHGKEKVEEMKKMARQTKIYTVADYLEIETRYKDKYETLLSN